MALADAILYCIPTVIFIYNANFSKVWLLYLGTALFLMFIIASVMLFKKQLSGNAGFWVLLTKGLILAVVAIIIICIIEFILLAIQDPAAIGFSSQGSALRQAPVSLGGNQTHSMALLMFVNAALVNFAAGAFGAFIVAITAKRNQT